MSMKYVTVLLAGLFLVQPVFADDATDKPCSPVVKACLDAGYTRHEGEDKQFWKDCMKPILLNQPVADVAIDAKEVKACRTDRIAKMKQELATLKKANK